MKKSLLILTISVMSLLIITACGNNTSQQTSTGVPKSDTQQTTQIPQNNSQAEQFIGEDRAKEIALERAGLTETDVSFVRVDLDLDDGLWKYEIEFRQGRTEYETEINAQDGTILAWETDND